MTVQIDNMGGLHLPYHNVSRVRYSVTSRTHEVSPEEQRAPTIDYSRPVYDRYLQTPVFAPRLAELANHVTQQAATPFEKVVAIQQHLLLSYQYSLDIETTQSESPIEDFLFERKTGYCEHYATAMVMMLRAIGIPARLVTGFLATEWNDFGNYFTVRQRDAHAWVEVYFPRSGWVSYDPTPVADASVTSSRWEALYRCDAEGENIYQDFRDRKGEIIAGSVHRFNKGNIIINLGRTEAVLPLSEQVPRETYHQGDRLKACIIDIRKSTRDPQVILSRTSPQFLVKLFELEVPEISEGVIKIISAAREPGERAKISVYSSNRDVDPVGACVGMKGSRVQNVVQELREERIDIIPWSQDHAKYVCNALAPAKVSRVYIDEENRHMEVVVADDQLSLAIGKKGQNVRLTSKLTGWKIDIKSESKMEKVAGEVLESFRGLPNIGDVGSRILYNEGYRSLRDLAEAEPGFSFRNLNYRDSIY